MDQSGIPGRTANDPQPSGPPRHRFGARTGWSDVEIFDRAGLRTYTARSEKLLRLVNDNRVQLFSRGVAELEAETSVVRSLYPQMLLDALVREESCGAHFREYNQSGGG